MDELRETFDHFDTDGNGRIDRAEFARLMDALGAEMTPFEIDVGFASIDADGDGSIDMDELAAWWLDR